MAHDQSPMALTLRTRRPVGGYQAVAERPDGSRFNFAPHPVPLFDDDGALVGAVNMLIDISERTTDEDAAFRLAAIVESSDDAIVSKTLDGVITSWNAGAVHLFGYAPEDIIGRSVLTLIPDERHHEEDEIIAKLRSGQRIDHYETVRRRKDGSLIDVSLTVSPIRRHDGTIIGASKIARDITYRKNAEEMLRHQAQRLATLNRVSRSISRDLDLDRIIRDVTDIATELAGAKFGAFFYKATDASGEVFQLAALSGARRSAFEGFGMPRATEVFKPTVDGVAVMRSDDVRLDPRYGTNDPVRRMWPGHLPVVSYLAVPVVAPSGQVIAGLFFGHDEPGKFGEQAETLIEAVAAQSAVAIENARLHLAAKMEVEQRRQAQAEKELLLGEIKHRIKNTLATVQAVAVQSLRTCPPVERTAFLQRLRALAGTHDLLTQDGGDAVPIRTVVTSALQPFVGVELARARMTGPDYDLGPANVLRLSLILHELATNAAKYGALSAEAGQLTVSWQIDKRERPTLLLQWTEAGGPTVVAPTRKGFGTSMIERAAQAGGGATGFEYAADGLHFTLTLSV